MTRYATLAAIFFVLGMLVTGAPALATHYNATITWPINNVTSVSGCHGDTFYFEESGWARSCANAKDIGNGASSLTVYIRGSGWSYATITAWYGNKVYPNQTCSGSGYWEYGTRWEVTLADGIAGVAFHHLSGFTYEPPSQVANGYSVATMANHPIYNVYYCSGALAATGAHIHQEAARYGTITDVWESTQVKWTHNACPC